MIKKIIIISVLIGMATLAFAEDQKTVLCQVTPTGCVCSAPIKGGTRVVLTATPNMGSKFVRWSGVACEEGQTSRICSFIMPESATTANARFDKLPKPVWRR